jgi:hypothetical protein
MPNRSPPGSRTSLDVIRSRIDTFCELAAAA